VKELKNLSIYVEGVSHRTPTTGQFVDEHGAPAPLDKAFINTYIRKIQQGAYLKPLQFAETAFPQKAEIVYSEREISVKRVEDDVAEIIPNTFIPLHGKKNRQGLQHLLVSICSFWDLQRGKLELIFTGKEWKNWFHHSRAQVDFDKLIACHGQIFGAITSHTLGQKAVSRRETVAGANFVDLMSCVLSECPIEDYWAVHTSLATRFYRAFILNIKAEKKKLKCRMVTEGDKSVQVMGDSFTLLSKAGQDEIQLKLFDFKEKLGFFPVVHVRSAKPVVKCPPTKAMGFSEAFSYMQESLHFRGGSKRGLGMLTANLGYVNTLSERSRRAIRIISMIDAAEKTGQQVDVKIKTGDFSMVFMTYAQRTQVDDKIRFVIPMDDRDKISDTLHYAIIHAFRPKAVLVTDMAKVPKTFSKHTSYEEAGKKHSRDLMSNLEPGFMITAPVLSDLYWAPQVIRRTIKHEDGQEEVVTETKPSRFKVYPLHSYPWDFSCVLTDLEYEKFEEKVVPYGSFAELCVAVGKANTFMNTYFLNPRSSFSPWVNRLKGPSSTMRCEFSPDGSWNIEMERPPDEENVEDDSDEDVEDDRDAIQVPEDDPEARQNIRDRIKAKKLKKETGKGNHESGQKPSMGTFREVDVDGKEKKKKKKKMKKEEDSSDSDVDSSGGEVPEGEFEDVDDPGAH